MSFRRIAGIGCLLLAVALGISAGFSLSQGPALNDPSGLGVSRAVGAFLPSLLLLILGLSLVQGPRNKSS